MRDTIIYCGIMLVLLASILVNKKPNNNNKPINKTDTIYNYIIKDSIKRNIIIKDSIVYNIRKEMIYEIENIKNYSNDSSIELFKELTSEY